MLKFSPEIMKRVFGNKNGIYSWKMLGDAKHP